MFKLIHEKNIEILLTNKTIEVHFNKELKNHKIKLYLN